MKHLSELMDTAFPADHYPVRRKRRPRRLNPNWDGIRWLEEQSETDTEIHSELPAGECDSTSPTGYEFTVQRALGYYRAKRKNMYPRPMFQVLHLGAGSASARQHLNPCPACDDWSRTSRCSEHHDRDGVAGLRMGAHRRAARNERRNGPVTVYSDAPRGSIVDTLLEMYRHVTRSLETPGRLEITGETLQPPATITIEIEYAVTDPGTRDTLRGFFFGAGA